MKVETFTNWFLYSSFSHQQPHGMGLGAPNPNCLNTTNNIRLILAPKSYKAQENLKDQMLYGIVNALGSYFFSTNDREETALQ